MKHLLALALTLTTLSLAASAAAPHPMLGGQRDKHGCSPSAGQSWSQVRKSCIRVFADAIRLHPVKPDNSGSVIDAFVIFASDKNQKQAEIFLANSKASVLLKQVPGNGAGEWRNASYKLSQWKGMYMLDTAKGKPLYQGPAAP